MFCAITSLNVMAQNGRKVEGIVADDNGRPLPNATISAVGVTESAKCDERGNFVMYVSYNTHAVTASCEGYYPSTQELDGMMLIFRLKVDPQYAAAKAKAEEEARIAAAEAAAAKARAEEQARIAAEREAAAKAKAEEQARIVAEREAAAKAKAEEQARIAAEREAAAKAKAEEQARIAAEKAAAAEAAAKAKAEEKARIEAEREAAAKAKAEEQARIAAEKEAAAKAAAKTKAEEQARIAAEKEAAAEAAAKAKAEEEARIEARIAELARTETANGTLDSESSSYDKLRRQAIKEERRMRIAALNVEELYTGYASMVDLSMTIMHNYRVGVSYIGGYSFNQKVFAGVGVGIDMALTQGDVVLENGASTTLPRGCYAIPAYLYFRYNFMKKRVSPYVAIAAGGHFSFKREVQLPLYRFTIPGINVMVNPQVGARVRLANKLDLNVGVGLNVYSTTHCLKAWPLGAGLQRKLQCAMDLHVGIFF